MIGKQRELSELSHQAPSTQFIYLVMCTDHWKLSMVIYFSDNRVLAIFVNILYKPASDFSAVQLNGERNANINK